MSLKSILSEIDSLKTALDGYYPIPLDRLQKINYKFRLDWNYHSNKMEGGTLTFEETRSVMMAQLEIHGKPLRDVLEMRGHDEIIKNIQKMGQGDVRLTENRIKDIHKAIIFDEEDLPGRFKNRDNYIYNYAGERFDFTPKEDTAAALNALTNWLDNALNALKNTSKKPKNQSIRTIPDIAFEYHLRFLTIHPFLDGNGRTGRILLNLILISNGYPPIVIRTEEKDVYGKHIAHAQQYEENPVPLYEMLGNLLIRSLQTCIKGAKGESLFELEDWEKRLEFLQLSSDEMVKSAATIQTVLQNSVFPFLADCDLKLASFDKLFAHKSKTVEINHTPISNVNALQKEIEKWSALDTINVLTIRYDWSDYKRSVDVKNMHIILTIKFLDKSYSINSITSSRTFSIEKQYNSLLTQETTQRFINDLGNDLMDNIERQMSGN